MIILATTTTAVEIRQVLYNPLNSDNGGEAIELYNPDEQETNLDGWIIATGASDQDVTFPKNATIQPHSYFLIADEKWNTAKDNAEWREADYEETITLSNTDSGIALKNQNGSLIDAVGWGDATKIKPGLYSGKTAKQTKEGNSLIRTKRTGDNSADFEEQTSSFADGQTINIQVTVIETEEKINSAILLEDDSIEEGTQIKPTGKTKNLTIIADIRGTPNAYAEFAGKNYAFTKINSTIYKTTLQISPATQAGNHTITIFASMTTQTINFTYLPLKKFETNSKNIKINAFKGYATEASEPLLIKNTGNLPLTILVNSGDLKKNNSTISSKNLFLRQNKDLKKKISEQQITLQPDEEKEILLSIEIPEDAETGEYNSVIKLFSN